MAGMVTNVSNEDQISAFLNDYDENFASWEESHLNFMWHLISAARPDGPCCNAETEMRSADAFHEEEPHLNVRQVSL